MPQLRRRRMFIGISLIVASLGLGIVVRLLALWAFGFTVDPMSLNGDLPTMMSKMSQWAMIIHWTTIVCYIIAATGSVLSYVEWARWFLRDEAHIEDRYECALDLIDYCTSFSGRSAAT